MILLLCLGILFSNALRAQSLYVIHDWTGRHEKIGLIDSSGTIVVKPKFSEIGYPDFRFGPVPAKYGKKWGYIDENGNWVIGRKFDWARPFRNGLAKVLVGEKFGFINQTGKWVIPPQFDGVDDFDDTIAPAFDGGKWGAIDRTGRWVIPPQFDYMLGGLPSDSGYIRVEVDGLWGLIRYDGTYAITPQYEKLSQYFGGLSTMQTDNGWGYLDTLGRFAIEPQFDDAHSFFYEVAWVKVGDLWGLIDKTGKFVAEPFCEDVDMFYAGSSIAAAQKDSLWGYVNTKGEWVIPPQFNYAWPFYDEFALVNVIVDGKEKYGFINQTGEWVVKPVYDDACNYLLGWATVFLKDPGNESGKLCALNKTGRCVWEEKVKYIPDFIKF